MLKTVAFAALTAAALALPAAASARSPYPYDDARPYLAQYYGQPRGDWDRGDWDRDRGQLVGYPEFRGEEEHIRHEIRDGVREDLIERDDARDLMGQLRDIQMQEAREFQVHGWGLPGQDRYRIRSRLDQLDREVDQIRAEP